MEIRPDRFKAVAAKTLGKIYGYVKSLWEKLQPKNSVDVQTFPLQVKKKGLLFLGK